MTLWLIAAAPTPKTKIVNTVKLAMNGTSISKQSKHQHIVGLHVGPEEKVLINKQKQLVTNKLAEREGFEPPEGLHPLRFSRPSR